VVRGDGNKGGLDNDTRGLRAILAVFLVLIVVEVIVVRILGWHLGFMPPLGYQGVVVSLGSSEGRLGAVQGDPELVPPGGGLSG